MELGLVLRMATEWAWLLVSRSSESLWAVEWDERLALRSPVPRLLAARLVPALVGVLGHAWAGGWALSSVAAWVTGSALWSEPERGLGKVG